MQDVCRYNQKKTQRQSEQNSQTQNKTDKSGTGPDFVLDDGSVRLCACASKTLLATVLAPSAGLTSESAAGPDLFGAAEETPQAAVSTPPDVVTLVSALTPDSDADQVLFGGCSTASTVGPDLCSADKGVCTNPRL